MPALVALVSGCARHAEPVPPANLYQHPDYARLSPGELLIESQRKGVMGRKRSLHDVQRTAEVIGQIVAEAVRQPAVQPDLLALSAGSGAANALRGELQSLQEADLLLESGGDPNAVSSAGAVGVAQWLAGTARRAGLRVDEREYAGITARAGRVRSAIGELRRRPPEWRRSVATGGPPLGRDAWIAAREAELRDLERRRLAADERCDPRKAIFAQTRYLVRLWRRFGSMEWALQAYHGGERGVDRTLNFFAADGGPRPVSFSDLYFSVSPRGRPRTFAYLYGRADDHRYYGWRVRMAQRALALYREDPVRFRASWQSLAPGYPLDRAWYPDALSAPLACVEALQAAYESGLLLPIPDDPIGGLTLGAVAPLDPANERWYRGLRPEALGMLRRLAVIYRESGGRAPLRVVGAASTVEYAERGTGDGGRGTGSAVDRPTGPTRTGEAGSEPPPGGPPVPPLTLHAAGLAVDVARPADPWDRKVLEYALSTLGDRMRIAWLRDLSANAYHLCPNPAFAAEFGR